MPRWPTPTSKRQPIDGPPPAGTSSSRRRMTCRSSAKPRSRCRTSASTSRHRRGPARCDRQCDDPIVRGQSAPDPVHRQADEARGPNRFARPSPRPRRPRQGRPRPAPGRALARRAAGRRRAPANWSRNTPTPTCSSCAAWCAPPERRSWCPASATAALTAIVPVRQGAEKAVQRGRRRRHTTAPTRRTMTQPSPRALDARAHRPGVGQRPRVGRRLRGQGHSRAARLAQRAPLRNPIAWEDRLIADDAPTIGATLVELVDDAALRPGADHRRHRPGAARRHARGDAGRGRQDMPGFGEQMRQISLHFVPTAILSRQMAVIRGRALIINLPGQPKSIAETLRDCPTARRRCMASSPRCPIAST